MVGGASVIVVGVIHGDGCCDGRLVWCCAKMQDRLVVQFLFRLKVPFFY